MRRTWRALLEPKRLVPVLLVSAALVTAQASFGGDRLAVPLGVAMCLAFVLVAPVSWRVLFPFGPQLGQLAVRLSLYAAVGTAVVLVIGVVLPRLLCMRPTLLTLRGSMVVCLALFLAGGWGLARDIDFDDRLRAAESRAVELERAAERAQLLALRAHLDPHFLFNTLNAIAEWCRQDGEVAERAVLQLSAMLRAILAGVRARQLAAGHRAGADAHAVRSVPPARPRAVPAAAAGSRPRCPRWRCRRCCCCRWRRTPSSTARRRATAGAVSLTVTTDEAAGRLLLTLDNPGAWNGHVRAAKGCAW